MNKIYWKISPFFFFIITMGMMTGVRATDQDYIQSLMSADSKHSLAGRNPNQLIDYNGKQTTLIQGVVEAVGHGGASDARVKVFVEEFFRPTKVMQGNETPLEYLFQHTQEIRPQAPVSSPSSPPTSPRSTPGRKFANILFMAASPTQSSFTFMKEVFSYLSKAQGGDQGLQFADAYKNIFSQKDALGNNLLTYTMLSALVHGDQIPKENKAKLKTMLELLVENCPISALLERNHLGQSALQLAIDLGMPDVARKILKKMFDDQNKHYRILAKSLINGGSLYGETPLLSALLQGDQDLFRELLIEHGDRRLPDLDNPLFATYEEVIRLKNMLSLESRGRPIFDDKFIQEVLPPSDEDCQRQENRKLSVAGIQEVLQKLRENNLQASVNGWTEENWRFYHKNFYAPMLQTGSTPATPYNYDSDENWERLKEQMEQDLLTSEVPFIPKSRDMYTLEHHEREEEEESDESDERSPPLERTSSYSLRPRSVMSYHRNLADRFSRVMNKRYTGTGLFRTDPVMLPLENLDNTTQYPLHTDAATLEAYDKAQKKAHKGIQEVLTGSAGLKKLYIPFILSLSDKADNPYEVFVRIDLEARQYAIIDPLGKLGQTAEKLVYDHFKKHLGTLLGMIPSSDPRRAMTENTSLEYAVSSSPPPQDQVDTSLVEHVLDRYMKLDAEGSRVAVSPIDVTILKKRVAPYMLFRKYVHARTHGIRHPLTIDVTKPVEPPDDEHRRPRPRRQSTHRGTFPPQFGSIN